MMTTKKAKRSKKKPLTEVEFTLVRRLTRAGMNRTEIADAAGITLSRVDYINSKIRQGQRYGSIEY